jgi:hypothetical protein
MTGGGVMLIVTVADFAELATEVAVTMAVGSALETSGLVVEAPLAMAFATAPTAGALYVTEVKVWFVSEPGPLKLHVTP